MGAHGYVRFTCSGWARLPVEVTYLQVTEQVRPGARITYGFFAPSALHSSLGEHRLVEKRELYIIMW